MATRVPCSPDTGAATASPTPREALALQLALIAGPRPEGYVEIRWRRRGGGMGQDWFVADRLADAADHALRIGQRTDVYLGAAPRRERHGGKAAVPEAFCLWVDCDAAAAAERLRAFRPAPSMILRSGGEGHLHGWWALSEPLGAPGDLERALRRLVHHLGADASCAEAARVMRAAGTRNFKRGEPMAVEVDRLEVHTFTATEVVGALADPPCGGPCCAAVRERQRSPVQSQTRSSERRLPEPGSPSLVADDPLRTIPATVYIPALTGRELGRDSKIACPFHEDRTPSLHAYSAPEQGWVCYGCRRGGSMIDLGAALYGLEPRGADYGEIRRRLATELLRAAV